MKFQRNQREKYGIDNKKADHNTTEQERITGKEIQTPEKLMVWRMPQCQA